MQDNETTIDELSATRARSRANLDKGRGLRAHKPDCGCRPCTKRRRV